MNGKDLIRIAGYAISGLSLVTASGMTSFAHTWGMNVSDATISIWAARVASISLPLTLIYSVFVKPSTPTGYTEVITPKADGSSTPVATSVELTTSAEVKAAKKDAP